MADLGFMKAVADKEGKKHHFKVISSTNLKIF